MGKKHKSPKQRNIIRDIYGKAPKTGRRKTRGHSRAAIPSKSERLPLTTGRITMTPGGFGFVAPDEGDQDIFIPVKFTLNAMDGDTVKVAILPKREGGIDEGKGPAGKVVEILERKRETVVGELLAGHKIRPLNKRITEDIQVSGSLCGAKRGDWIEVKLLQTESGGYKRGIVNKRIGQVGTIQSDLDAVMAEYDLPEPYTERQNQDAAKIERVPIDRTDLTDVFTITVDPHDAKDFDDAISIAPGDNPNEIQLGVHIADVAAWITRKSEWNKEAYLRAFTAYLPGRTLPMLPRDLTALISLTENVVSPAHTVMFTVDTDTGNILKTKRFHSRIKVNSRLNYAELQEYLDTKKPLNGWDKDFVTDIDKIYDVFTKMRSLRKQKEQFLEIATTEIRVLCDEGKNEITGIARKNQREADQIIEEFMLAANSAVAEELITKKVPGLFRTHPEPDPDKLEEFVALMLGSFGIDPGNLLSRTEINKFLRDVEDGPKKPIIMNSFLRSLPRAMYKAEPELHFGLGKTMYSHFTSPIRRYPDLVVHQQLWALDTGDKLRSNKKFEEIASNCTEKEANNDEAWYSANDRLKLRYLQQMLDEEAENELLHEGLVAKVNAAGLLVDIQSLGIYGFVPIDSLRGNFKLRRSEGRLVSVYGKTEYKAGDFIYLRLSQIDFIKGQAVFKPA